MNAMPCVEHESRIAALEAEVARLRAALSASDTQQAQPPCYCGVQPDGSVKHKAMCQQAQPVSDTQDDARDFDAWWDRYANEFDWDEGRIKVVVHAAWDAARRIAQPTKDMQRAYDVAREVWAKTNIIEAVVDAVLALFAAAPGPAQGNDHEATR